MKKVICVLLLAATLNASLAAAVVRCKLMVTGPGLAIETERADEPEQPGQSEGTLNISKERWREDLKFFARELPRRHANAFHYISRERFETEVAELDRRIEGLDG